MNGLSTECRNQVGPDVRSDVDSPPTSLLAAHSHPADTEAPRYQQRMERSSDGSLTQRSGGCNTFPTVFQHSTGASSEDAITGVFEGIGRGW